MQVSREWATPVTIGAFMLMSVTGVLMFFHADRGFNKLAHEWVGLVMVGGVAAHAMANWAAFTRYGLVLLAASFVSWTEKRLPPPVMAMRAIVAAPLAKVAPLAGRSADQAIADLARAGVTVANPNVSLEAATGGNREMQAKAISALFGKGR